MSRELFTSDGKRKYLTEGELAAFLSCVQKHERGAVRTFCLVLAHTGCRISEALALNAGSVDLSARTISFQTLKQRGRIAYRAVPVPDSVLDALELVHAIRKAQRAKRRGSPVPLWSWGRTQAWNHVKAAMDEAGISGPHASPKGLRHGFGVRAATKTRQPRMVQKWLGHRSLETTAIYMDAQGDEERALAARMWD